MSLTVTRSPATRRRERAATLAKSALVLNLMAALLSPAAGAAMPVDDARKYLGGAPQALAARGDLPVIDAAATIWALGACPESDALRFDLSHAIPDNSEAALARLIALEGSPYADEVAAGAWLLALFDGTTGLAQGWTGADPIVIARALELTSLQPVPVQFVDADGMVSSIYALLPSRLLTALSATQRAVGGLGFADEGPDIAATAEALLALERYPSDLQASAMAPNARVWLAAQAKSPAGLPAADLALILLASATPPDVTESMLMALEARQWPDGSFDGDIRSTALALRALSKHLPNVALEVPADVQMQVGQGQRLAVVTRVHDTSERPVPASVLGYRLIDPGGGIVATGQLPVTAMLGGESRTAVVGLTAPTVVGTYTLELTANVTETFHEGRYDDNLLRLRIRVTEPADLVLEPVDITMIPFPPILHETTRITVRVRNLGETPAENVHVQLFSGPPVSGGTLLGETVLNVVARGVPRSLDVNYTPRTLDPITLVARVDPSNTVIETNEANNETSVTVNPKTPADIQADFSAYSLTPAPGSKIAQGEPVIVTAWFNFKLTRFGQPPSFLGAGDLWPYTAVPVVLYRDAPDGTSTVVSSTAVILRNAWGALSSAYSASFPLPPDAASGVYRLRFVVDPNATIPEVDRSNNSISTTFEITNSGVAELLFDAGSVKADAPIVDATHPTIVRGRVRNIGLATAVNVPVEFKAPNRTVTAYIAVLAPGQAQEVSEAITFADMTGRWDVGLTIDPAKTIPESTKSNNTATAALRPTSCAIAFNGVTAVPDPTPGGTTAVIRIEAKNVGYVPIEGFTARAIFGGGVNNEVNFRPTIAVGQLVAVDLPVSLARIVSGDLQAVVEMQPWSTSPPQYGPLVSSDLLMRVRRPDLAVASRGIQLEKSIGPLGEELLVPTVNVNNLGGLSATSSVRLYRGYASARDLVEAGSISVAAGGTAIYKGSPFAAPSVPPFVVTVVLDEENAVIELDETNNTWTRPVEKNLGDVVVAFDETHGPGSTVGLNPDMRIGSFAGDHADWVADLEAHGYVVTTLNPDASGLTPSKLRGVDVLVSPTSTKPFTNDEQSLLSEFVKRGGGYFLMGEWGSATYAPRWREWENSVASVFGLVPLEAQVARNVPCGGPCQSFGRVDGQILPHPVTDGVERMFGAMSGGFSALPPGATVLVKSGGYSWSPMDTPVVGVLEVGSGRVGFTGEGTMADASIADCGLMIGCGLASPYYNANNRRLVRQMIDWLANGGVGDFPGDLAVTPPTVRLSNPDPIAGELVRVAVTVRNIGGASTTMGPTLVRFYDGPAPTGSVLAEVKVPDLPVDQAFEAFFDWDTTRAAGLHTITAVVDPDGLIPERLETNNSAAVDVRVRARYDLRVDPSDIAIAPGSPPQVSVKVHNVGYSQAPAGAPLRLRVVQGGLTRPLGELALPAVPARGGVTTVSGWVGEFPDGAFSLEAVVDPDDTLHDPDRATNAASFEVAPPELFVDAPTRGIAWGGTKTVRWTSRSILRPKLVASVAVGPKGGALTGQGSGDGSFKLDTTQFPDGEYAIRVTVDDGLQRTVREVPFTIANTGLTVRTFAGADTWTSAGVAGVATLMVPVGSRVLSATALLDSQGTKGVRIGTGIAGNLRTGGLLRFRGRLHYVAVQDEVLRDWTSDDDGATWKAPADLSLPGERVTASFSAANSQAIHVAYQLLEGTPRLFLTSSVDGVTWSPRADWGSGPSNDIELTATEEGVTSLTTYGPGNLYVATADPLGRIQGPTAHVSIPNFASPAAGIRIGGRLRIAFTDAASGVDPAGALAYTEVPVASYADPSAYAKPVKLDEIPNQVTLGIAGGHLDLAYTVGQYQRYQRCTIGDDCTLRDRWLPEPASNGWQAPALRLAIAHGTTGSGTASTWYHGGIHYAARSIRNGSQWGDWTPLGLALPVPNDSGMLFEEASVCGAGDILTEFNFACWPLLTPRVQTLDVGGDGTLEGSRRTARAGSAEVVDLTAALNGWLAVHSDGDDGVLDGQISVPVNVTSFGAGQTVLRNLEVRYVPVAGIAGFAEPALFSPGASPGVLDTTVLSFASPGPISIVTPSGTTARTLNPTPANTRYAAVFDGRSSDGGSLPSGRYGFGPPGAIAGEVEIDDILPTATLGELNGPMGGRVQVTGVATDFNFEGLDRNFAGFALEWSADGVSWSLIAAGSRPTRGLLAEWNTTGVRTGNVQLRLTVRDRAGNTSVAQRGVYVDPAVPAPPLITSPTLAGSPIDVVGPRVDLAGTGVIGTTVRVYRNGVAVGDAPCDGNWSLGAVELPSGISTFTARSLKNGAGGGEAAPIVVGRYALQIGVSGPPDVARPGEATATVTVARTSVETGPLEVALSVLDITGAPVWVAVQPDRVVVSPTNSAAAKFDAKIATAGASPGTYRLRASVAKGGLVPSTASSLFKITAPDILSARLVSDRAVYAASSPIELTATLQNAAGVGDALGITALINVTDPGGVVTSLAPVLIGDLAAGQLASRSVVLAGPRSTGSYQAALVIVDAFGTVHSTASTSFDVVADAPGAALYGTIAVAPTEYKRGLPVQASFTIRNDGSAQSVTAGVLLVDPGTGAIVARSDGARSVASGETWAGTVQLQTPMNLGDLIALLVANGRAVAAASVPVSLWADVTPPDIQIAGVVAGEYRSGTVLPVVTVTDESAFTSTQLLDGAAFVEGTVVSAEGLHVLIVQARDAWNNASSASVFFTIDRTPPVITVAGVTDGGSQPVPASPTYGATDDHLSGAAAATLDGVAFVSGTAVDVPGEHVLVVTATDLAGNASTTTVKFTLTVPVGDATIDARADDGPRVLVGLGCHDEEREAEADGARRDHAGGHREDVHEADDEGAGDEPRGVHGCVGASAAFLRATLDAALIPYEVTAGGDAFQQRFRAHWHGVRVLYRYDAGEHPSLAELREATWAGGGLVVVLARHPDEDPTLGDALGLRPSGIAEIGGQATIVDGSPLGLSLPLSFHGRAARLRLEGAAQAVVARTGDAIVSTHPYGKGRVVTISFNPEENATEGVADLLVRAIRWAASGETVAPVAGAPFFAALGVTEPPGSAADLRLIATPPTELAVLAAPLATTLEPPTWQFTLGGGESTTRSLVLRTPPSPLPPVDLLLSRSGKRGWRDIATSSIVVPPAPDVLQLRTAAVDAIEALAVGARDRERREKAIREIRSIPAPPRSAHEAAESIRPAIRSVNRLRAITTADVGAARSATDALLRALEVRSLTTP